MPAHVYRCPMRWADMDAFGIVNNVVFARYLEQARVDLLFDSVSHDRELGAMRAGIVVARLELDYRAPLRWRAEGIDVTLRTTAVGGASFRLAYEVRDQQTVYATAETVLVAYDFDRGSPRRLSASERTWLQGYADDAVTS